MAHKQAHLNYRARCRSIILNLAAQSVYRPFREKIDASRCVASARTFPKSHLFQCHKSPQIAIGPHVFCSQHAQIIWRNAREQAVELGMQADEMEHAIEKFLKDNQKP